MDWRRPASVAWQELNPNRGPPESPKDAILAEQSELQERWSSYKRVEVDRKLYIWGILIMAVVTGLYTILGGLRAVIITT